MKTQGTSVVKGKLAVEGDANFEAGLNAPYLEIIDLKDSGVAGGTFSGNAVGWVTRDLTNTVFDDFATSITLASNPGDGGSITLEKGTYYCEASAPAFNVGEHVARLADVTDEPGNFASTVVLGTSEFSADTAVWQDSVPDYMTVASASQTRSQIRGKFRLHRQSTLEIQHRCANSQVVDGLGSDSGGSFYVVGFYTTDQYPDMIPNNVYTIVQMWMLASK